MSALFSYPLGKKQGKWGCCRTVIRLACILPLTFTSLQKASVLRLLSAQKQRFSFVAEIPKKYNGARAQHKHSPPFPSGCWCSHWHSSGPWQPAVPQVWPGTGSSTHHTLFTPWAWPNAQRGFRHLRVSQAGPHNHGTWDTSKRVIFKGSPDKWGLGVSGATFTIH